MASWQTFSATTRNRYRPTLASAGEPPQELAGPVLLRIGQNLLGRTGFDDPATVEEAHPVGHLAGECHLVGMGGIIGTWPFRANVQSSAQELAVMPIQREQFARDREVCQQPSHEVALTFGQLPGLPSTMPLTQSFGHLVLAVLPGPGDGWQF